MSARDLRPKRSRVARIAYSVGTTTEARGYSPAAFRVTAVTVSIAHAAILSSRGKNRQAGNKVEAIDRFKDAKVCEEANM